MHTDPSEAGLSMLNDGIVQWVDAQQPKLSNGMCLRLFGTTVVKILATVYSDTETYSQGGRIYTHRPL